MTGDMETDDQDERTPAKPTSSSSADTNILSVLESRRQMYVKAVETAKASQDAAKTRRLDRQLKVMSCSSKRIQRTSDSYDLLDDPITYSIGS